jgi:hypothetical protein
MRLNGVLKVSKGGGASAANSRLKNQENQESQAVAVIS